MRLIRRYPLLFPALFFLSVLLVIPPVSPPDDSLRQLIERREVKPVLLRALEYCRSNGRTSRFEAELIGIFRGSGLEAAHRKVLVKLGEGACAVIPGGTYQAWAKFSWPDRFQNPSSFDYPTYLLRQNIRAVLSVKQGELLTPWGPEPPWYLKAPARLRSGFLSVLEHRMESAQARGILAALLVGDESGLSPETREIFRRTGLTHLLVVSGLHLTLIFVGAYYPLYGLLSLSVRWSNRGWARRAALLLALLPTLFYVGMVGGSPSVLRAWVFALLMVFLLHVGWRIELIALLIFACCVLLLWDPFVAHDLSFQFSFLAVLALVLVAKRLTRRRAISAKNSPWAKILRGAGTLIVSSVAVNLALFPLMATQFHQVSWIAPLTNLMMVPLFSFVIHPLGLAAVGLELMMSGAGTWLLAGVEWVVSASLVGLAWAAQLNWSDSWVSPLGILEWIAWSLFAGGVFFLRRRWIFPAFTIALVLTLLALGSAKRHPAGFLIVRMFDVGQGESLLVTFPEGKHLLVDGGGFSYSDFDIGRNVLIPELLRLGIHRLDALVLTHADADHWKGLVSLVQDWSVTEFWTAPATLPDPQLRALRLMLQDKAVPTKEKAAGESETLGGAELRILWPERGFERALVSDNNRSLVLEICLKEICWLLTGDLEAEGESGMRSRAKEDKIYLLKTAHHGSRTSSTRDWLQSFDPRIALLSAGRRNRFGMPHHEVTDRFAEMQIPMFRTDRDGQIVVRTDGRRVDLYTFSGLRRTWFIGRPIPSWWFANRWEPFS